MPQVTDATEQQLWLFQPQMEVSVAYLNEQREKLARAIQAPNTQKGYACDWRHFQAWCTKMGRSSLPATADTIALFATYELDRGKRVVTVEHRICGILDAHRRNGVAPPETRGAVRDVVTGARHLRKEVPAVKDPLTPAELRKISRMLRTYGEPRDVRDRAVMVLGFASGLRRSNLSALNMADVQIVRKGVIVKVRSSKTDQNGKGVTLGLHRGKNPDTCPVRTLSTWLKLRGEDSGPLFLQSTKGGNLTSRRIGSSAIAEIVKRSVSLIGLRPERFAGHSLRSGCATAAFAGGAPTQVIMRRTGHRSVAMLDRYVRTVDPFAGINPLAKAL